MLSVEAYAKCHRNQKVHRHGRLPPPLASGSEAYPSVRTSVVAHSCRVCWHSFLSAATRCGNLGGTHEVTNVLLEELVIVVKLVVLFTHSLDTVENGDERVLQGFGMSALLGQPWFLGLVARGQKVGIGQLVMGQYCAPMLEIL